MIRNRITIFIVSFIILGFFFLSLPEKGYSGTDGMLPPVELATCCEFQGGCFDFGDVDVNLDDGPIPACSIDGLRTGFCNELTGLCEDIQSRNVPTLSQWGLISMAGVLGVIALFMVIRRRKISA